MATNLESAVINVKTALGGAVVVIGAIVGFSVKIALADEQIKDNKEAVEKLETQSAERYRTAQSIDTNLKFLIQELQIRGVIGQPVRTETAAEAEDER